MDSLVLNGATFVSTDKTDTVRTVTYVPIRTPKTSLPPLKFPGQNTVFLDLDDTLIHTVINTPPTNYDFVVDNCINGIREVYYILKRPFVDQFLRFLTQKGFEIVIFTAGVKDYASPILDKLDPKGLISHRLYRDSTRILNGVLVKDISRFGRDLKKAVIIDDDPVYYRLQPDNAIPVKSFGENLVEDDELIRLMKYFEGDNFLLEKKSKN